MSPASVIWITGLSGTGKSTLARQVVEDQRAEGGSVLLIDGDEFRAVHDEELGHDPADRLRNAMRLARFARYVASQGIPVVVATMSLFREVHDWNRENIPGYFEVLLGASIKFLASRDPKGLYAEAAAGGRSHVVGVDLQYDLPTEPDLRIDAEREVDPGELSRMVLERVRTSGVEVPRAPEV